MDWRRFSYYWYWYDIVLVGLSSLISLYMYSTIRGLILIDRGTKCLQYSLLSLCCRRECLHAQSEFVYCGLRTQISSDVENWARYD